jgi:predicted RNase H-like HicB family nuclease
VRYAIVIENAGSNYSAYVPDLPGCIATGETVAEIGRLIREAIEFISMAYGRTARRFHRRQAVSTTSKSPCERQP